MSIASAVSDGLILAFQTHWIPCTKSKLTIDRIHLWPSISHISISLPALFYTRSRQYLRTFEYLREDLFQVVSALGACWPACPLHFCRRIPELYATPKYSATGTFGPKVAFSITVPLVHIPAALEGYTPRAGVIKPPWLTLYMTNKVGMTNSPLDVSR